MPFIRVKCECGQAYRLKPKMAGKVIGCKQCYANISVPNVQFDEEELAAEIEAAAPKRKKKKRKETDKPIASDG